MTAKRNSLRRIAKHGTVNLVGTIIDTAVLWLFSTYIFHSYFGCYVVSPFISFESAVAVNFVLSYYFTWRDRTCSNKMKHALRQYVEYNASCSLVFVIRIGLILFVEKLSGLEAVWCNLIALSVTGLANYLISDKLIFKSAKQDIRGTNTKPLFLKSVIAICRFFCRYKVERLWQGPSNGKASVYVCNHRGLSGPVLATLHMPVSYRPWIHDVMLDSKKLTQSIIGYTFKCRYIECILKGTIGIAVKPICALLNAFNPIPAMRKACHEASQAIAQSVETLDTGENILLFPEKPRTRKSRHQLRDFYTGFAAIGEAYHRKTGEIVEFVPVYIDVKSRTLNIGNPVSYNPANDSLTEKRRIATTLHSRMKSMADKGCPLPYCMSEE